MDGREWEGREERVDDGGGRDKRREREENDK